MAKEIRPPAYSDIRKHEQQPAVAEPAVAGESAVADGQLRGCGGAVNTRGSGVDTEGGPDDESTSGAEDEFENDDPEIYGEWTDPVSHEAKPPNFGISCGNWGGDRKSQAKQQYMKNDINESPAHVYCLQEATQSLCQDLKAGWHTPKGKEVRYTDSNKRKMAKDSPKQHWLVVRGCERGETPAVAVRDAYFKAIRRDCFVKQSAG